MRVLDDLEVGGKHTGSPPGEISNLYPASELSASKFAGRGFRSNLRGGWGGVKELERRVQLKQKKTATWANTDMTNVQTSFYDTNDYLGQPKIPHTA